MIQDPQNPIRYLGTDGDLYAPCFMVPTIEDVHAPTVAELNAAGEPFAFVREATFPQLGDNEDGVVCE